MVSNCNSVVEVFVIMLRFDHEVEEGMYRDVQRSGE